MYGRLHFTALLLCLCTLSLDARQASGTAGLSERASCSAAEAARPTSGAAGLSERTSGSAAEAARPASGADAGSKQERSAWEKFAGAIDDQISGHCYFAPECYSFFPDAVRELGLLRGTLATFDRMTRCSRIGMAGRIVPSPDGRIHEGPEAYLTSRPSPEKDSRAGNIPSAEAASLPAEGRVPTEAGSPLPAEDGLAGEATLLPSGSAIPSGAPSAGADYDFVLYLLDNGLGRDATSLLWAPGQYAPSDTLAFLRGWTDYSLKRLDRAAAEFAGVGAGSPLYEKSLFFGAICAAHSGNLDSASERLESYDGPLQELRRLQLAGIALLRDDKGAFEGWSADFTGGDYTLAESERVLKEIAGKRFEPKRKSPLLAAGLSCIVPGMGKVYAGRTGEGISSFLVCGALGAITADQWVHHGPGNWKTIALGSVAAAFYLGNIYGSYFSVSIINDETRGMQDTAILYNMHIPLRSIFK